MLAGHGSKEIFKAAAGGATHTVLLRQHRVKVDAEDDEDKAPAPQHGENARHLCHLVDAGRTPQG